MKQSRLFALLSVLLAACTSAPPHAPSTRQGTPAQATPQQSAFLMDALRQRMQAPRAAKQSGAVVVPVASMSRHEPVVPPSAALMAALQPDAAGSNTRAAMLSQAAHADDAKHGAVQAVVPPAVSDAYDRALDMMRQAQYPQALQEFENLAAHNPYYSGPWVNQGLIFIQQKRYDDAEKALRRAIAINDANPYAWNALGSTLRHLGHFDEARHAYERALSLDPDYARAHFNLAILGELYLQDLPLALTHYMRYQALQTEPDPAVAHWIVDLKRRTGYKDPAPPQSPAVAPAPQPAGATS